MSIVIVVVVFFFYVVYLVMFDEVGVLGCCFLVCGCKDEFVLS